MQRYRKGLEEPMRGSEYIFDSICILYYNFNKISLVRSGSYIDIPKFVQNKEARVNPKNNDGICFSYIITAALNIDQI